LDFSAIGGKIQKHGSALSALIGAGGTGCEAPGLENPIILAHLFCLLSLCLLIAP
jgi:hypothetical protein